MFISKYPTSASGDSCCSSTNNNTSDNINEFPHKPIDFTKQRTSSKVKTIRQNYKKAIDLRRRSGGGRVVMTCYEQCNSIWSGSLPLPVSNVVLILVALSKMRAILRAMTRPVHLSSITTIMTMIVMVMMMMM